MHRPSPRRLARAVTRAVVVPLVAHAAFASPAIAQPLASHEFTTVFDQVPGAAGLWSQIGAAGCLVDHGELLINDNSTGDCIAFQSMVGEIQAAHRVTVTAEMRILTNFGGQSAVIEISRPGLELLVQLDTDRIDVLERAGDRELVWLTGAPAELASYHEVSVTKLSVVEDPRESFVVAIDGAEVVRVAGRGDGRLGVGRIVFGSLDYASLGASVWSRVDVSVVPLRVDDHVRTEERNMGALKADYRR